MGETYEDKDGKILPNEKFTDTTIQALIDANKDAPLVDPAIQALKDANDAKLLADKIRSGTV